MPLIQEHSTKINITLPQGDINAKMEVFYNPIMVSNRNISILLLNSLSNKNMILADPLAGSGIRSLRLLKELKKDKLKALLVNDTKDNFKKMFRDFLKLNKISKKDQKKIQVQATEATLFLLNHKGCDYIDIDPFGSPNPFLAAAVAAISRNGILAVTATDTAALTGTYPQVTKRKYWATSLKNHMMHETGLRILIRKVQLIGIQFDKALIPILAYHQDHYFRVYFRSEKGKEKCDKLIFQHRYFLYCPHCLEFRTSPYNKESCICKREFQVAGPIWTGQLFDPRLIKSMAEHNPFPEEQKFLKVLKEESAQEIVGFYDLHELASKLKRDALKLGPFIKKVQGTRTHFSPTGIKTKRPSMEVGSLWR